MSEKIDDIDEELLALLYQDGRYTLTDLGEKIKSVKGSKLSHVSVQKRLQKLIESDIVRIQANINVNKLEYISAFVLIETKDYETQKRIIERFRLCPRVVQLDLVSGKYNIILRAMAPNLKELECFLNYSWLKKEELRNIEIYISTTNVKPRYIPLPKIPYDKKFDQKGPCGSNCNLCDHYKSKQCLGCPATHYPEKEWVDPFAL